MRFMGMSRGCKVFAHPCYSKMNALPDDMLLLFARGAACQTGFFGLRLQHCFFPYFTPRGFWARLENPCRAWKSRSSPGWSSPTNPASLSWFDMAEELFT